MTWGILTSVQVEKACMILGVILMAAVLSYMKHYQIIVSPGTFQFMLFAYWRILIARVNCNKMQLKFKIKEYPSHNSE